VLPPVTGFTAEAKPTLAALYKTLSDRSLAFFTGTLNPLPDSLTSGLGTKNRLLMNILGADNPAAFRDYLVRYLNDPLACVREENQRLADIYAKLPRTGIRRKELSSRAEQLFDALVRQAILTRVVIEAALFPNGQKITQAAQIARDKYEEVPDTLFLRHHDCSPALVNARLGEVLEHGEIAGINKGETDSSGQPSVVFDFVVTAKKEAVSKLAAGQLATPNHRIGLARNIFDQLHCCRHRSPVLQLAYQEAGIRSAVYMGYAEKSDRFPGMLSGAHEWVMFDPYDRNSMTHLADPNRQYDDINPNARFLGQVTESIASGWTAAAHPELFDGEPHIFDFKSLSETYRKLTGQMRGAELNYYVAVERFNFTWRPLPAFTLVRQLKKPPASA
jgi:hypothetical protein